jgi:hypothetical protein
MRSSKIFALARLAVLGLAAAACSTAADGVGTEVANVDSFARPTEHGELMFGVANPAELTAESRFHAWTFKLSGKASVDLATELHTQNLDSVMYLYKKGASGWGENIASNDNHRGAMSSRIERALDEGEYLVKVKATHQAMRGHFDVVAACTGSGCPADAAGTCKAPAAELPAAGHYAPSCAGLFAKIAATPAYPAPAACAVLEDAAIAYYKEYWDNLGGWESMTGGEEVTFDTSVEHHPDAGTIVTVSLGGDEDMMTFVFDATATLRYYHQSNQSPDWAWFCDGAAAAEPDDDCIRNVRGGFPRPGVAPIEGSVTAGAQAEHELTHVEAAVDEYLATVTVPAGEGVSYAYRRFDGDYEFAAEVKVSAAGHPAITYVVSGDPRNDGAAGLTIVLKTDASGSEFLCRAPK